MMTIVFTAMIGVMSRMVGFTVYNPCTVLTTYHAHCSRISARLPPNRNGVDKPPYNIPGNLIAGSPPVRSLIYASKLSPEYKRKKPAALA